MKRCPECRRDYLDDSLLYCLEDGTALVQGSVPSPDEPRTEILQSTDAPSEAATKAQLHTTDLTGVDVVGGDRLSRFPTKYLVVVGAVVIILGAGFLGLRYFRPDAKQINSIAVMPFVNESGNAEIDYLTDGMTDTLISSLSQIPTLSVKAHTSVFRYKGKDTAPKVIANELGAQAILNGRVNQRGDALSVAVELIDPQSENVLWSDKYERKKADLVALQSEIARDVSSKLRSKLSGEDQARISHSSTVDPEAYQLYLKGLFYWNKRGKDSLLQATEFFNQAVAKDPSYALAYAGLAETYTLYPDYSIAKPEDSYPRSRTAALRALELDDSLAEAHAALGRYYNYWEWDRVQAEKEYRRAIELRPNFATAHHWLGSDTLIQVGRIDEAINECSRAQELDPMSPIISANVGDTLYYARRYDEAAAVYRKTIALDPSFYLSYAGLGYVLAAKGEYAESLASLRRALTLTSDPLIKGYYALALARSGDKTQALAVIEDMKRDQEKGYVPAYAFAIAYAAVGKVDEAFRWLNQEIDDHGTGGATLAVDPLVDGLRSDPRFSEVLKRVHL